MLFKRKIMVRSGGNIKIWKHNQGKKLPGILSELIKRGYIYKENGKIKVNEYGNQLKLNEGL